MYEDKFSNSYRKGTLQSVQIRRRLLMDAAHQRVNCSLMKVAEDASLVSRDVLSAARRWVKPSLRASLAFGPLSACIWRRLWAG